MMVGGFGLPIWWWGLGYRVQCYGGGSGWSVGGWVCVAGLGSVRVGCCRGFGFCEGGGGVDLVAVRYGCRCGCGCGCRCGCELLGWVWEGMGTGIENGGSVVILGVLGVIVGGFVWDWYIF
ncbi:hypothetical protein FCV25MIE_20732 [Fagus crenata]